MKYVIQSNMNKVFKVSQLRNFIVYLEKERSH